MSAEGEAGASVLGETAGVHGVGNSWLVDCTLAHNAGAGAQAIDEHALTFTNSILAGNDDDVVADSPVQAIWSCCADGALRAFPNCITADPLFVDPAAGDFRLAFGSPCVETGDPGPSGELDLLGHVRPDELRRCIEEDREPAAGADAVRNGTRGPASVLYRHPRAARMGSRAHVPGRLDGLP